MAPAPGRTERKRAMEDTQGPDLPAGTAALEHLTGPSRGTVTWFSGMAHDISLGANQFVHVFDYGATTELWHSFYLGGPVEDLAIGIPGLRRVWGRIPSR